LLVRTFFSSSVIFSSWDIILDEAEREGDADEIDRGGEVALGADLEEDTEGDLEEDTVEEDLEMTGLGG
jgi:hypothetical protein